MFVLLGVSLILTLLSTPVLACSCSGHASPIRIATMPSYGDEDVALNASIEVIRSSGVEPTVRIIGVEVNGFPWPVEIVDEDDPPLFRHRAIPLRPFQAFAEVTVLTETSDSWTFTTGSWTDEAPVEWGGRYTARNSRNVGAGPSCGPAWSQAFKLRGVRDDGPAEHLLSIGVPDDPDHGFAIGDGSEALNWYNLCGGDESLRDDAFHRSYEFVLLDAAGNRTQARRVSSLGCDHAPSPWWAVMLVPFLLRRRSAAEGSIDVGR